ncbi:DUF429 domain-containing protein [Metarhizobium album]|uniref:DUF429 domain-containing protein n=1 Tax=Metarhizobium album TaxID=2182425 RepID=A0A2U2DKD4_9HYPH|nr:DUF429 domain-containing protein [Rhizobium album]
MDAAWTLTEPSGVALIVERDGQWHLEAVSPSYAHFISDEAGRHRPRGSAVSANLLLEEAARRIGQAIDLVAIDMPLSQRPIISRRLSDNLVSSAYGARHGGTHSPSAVRPGAISDRLRRDLGTLGYPLLTAAIDQPGTIEVYPHPALIELLKAEKRLPYKTSKVRNYWRDDPPGIRRERLLGVWNDIVGALDQEVADTHKMLSVPAYNAIGWQMKAFEDMLDAVICAWVGACALDGKATPFGDQESAIWIPGSN